MDILQMCRYASEVSPHKAAAVDRTRKFSVVICQMIAKKSFCSEGLAADIARKVNICWTLSRKVFVEAFTT